MAASVQASISKSNGAAILFSPQQLEQLDKLMPQLQMGSLKDFDTVTEIDNHFSASNSPPIHLPTGATAVISHIGQVKKKKKMLGGSGEVAEMNSSSEICNHEVLQRPKRNKTPGVRVVGGRIYDPENGKTCHQCRQKTLDFSADCKNHVNEKRCTLKYCFTCLMNRYGEKAEDVASLEDWSCPRCRGICNCSICMKKRGGKPTGMLVQMAKASGFSSVSDLLHVKGAQVVGHCKNAKQIGGSPRKQLAAEEGTMTTSPKKLGKENIFDGKTYSNVIPPVLSPVEEKPNKKKRKVLKVLQDVNGVNGASPNKTSTTHHDLKHEGLTQTHNATVLQETSCHSDKKKLKKIKAEGSKEGSPAKSQVSKGYPKHGISNEKLDGVQQEEKAFKKNKVHKDTKALDSRSDQNTKKCVNAKKCHQAKNDASNLDGKYLEAVIPLPTGSELVTIAGVDIPKEDAGNALQFLEFCAAFGKILNVKRGQAEVVLRELIKGRSARRGKYSLIIQFHIQLLSVIQEDMGSESSLFDPTHGDDTWLKALKSCIPKSKHLFEAFDCIDKEGGGYDRLNSSMKLKLLNFLCDDVLGTEKIRNWIGDQNIKFAEQTKEAKEKLVAAKDKEKCLKQKMVDDVAEAVIARNGVPLTISEHEAVVSEIKKKVAQAHAEMLEFKRMVPIDKQRPDAVRTEPVFRDNKGNAYWRLKGYSDKSDILLQGELLFFPFDSAFSDIGTGDVTVESGENWFQFDVEQMTLIDKHINALREGRFRPLAR
ncbi:hypothetical protein L6452_44146 [Arctium lappa]|uniref:Uncharacterized protein n=1 Tax=Arctium lappa TaxID=4217 RepID=A0ACB8XEI2_ARCLA|nr:hypothetical protein L6452_44146 [Arctium lappa]